MLVTHEPPHEILDYSSGTHWGNLPLRNSVENANPLLHLFGHAHESYGKNWTHFVYKLDNLFRSIRVSDENSSVTRALQCFLNLFELQPIFAFSMRHSKRRHQFPTRFLRKPLGGMGRLRIPCPSIWAIPVRIQSLRLIIIWVR